MSRFLLGVLLGIAMAVGYVRYDAALPGWLQIAERLKGNLVSTATEADLYDLDRDLAVRNRALEVFFDNRAADAARLDAEAGHPFLFALYRLRAKREARQLLGERKGYETALAKPSLREALVRRHGTTDDATLTSRMLAAGLDKKPFLKRWLAQSSDQAGSDLLVTLQRVAASK